MYLFVNDYASEKSLDALVRQIENRAFIVDDGILLAADVFKQILSWIESVVCKTSVPPSARAHDGIAAKRIYRFAKHLVVVHLDNRHFLHGFCDLGVSLGDVALKNVGHYVAKFACRACVGWHQHLAFCDVFVNVDARIGQFACIFLVFHARILCFLREKRYIFKLYL